MVAPASSPPGRIDKRLDQLGIVLPPPAAPAANYAPFVSSGSLVFLSGQVSRLGDEVIRGEVGGDVSLQAGAQAARLCGLNLIALLRAACGGDLDRVVQVVKLNGFIQAAPGLEPLAAVMNGCSDLFVEVFGDAGRHARTTVGVYRLPSGYAVEADAIVEVRP